MTDQAEPYWILWRVNAVNRETRRMFQRELFLDAVTLPASELREVSDIVKDRERWPEIIRFRHQFREQATPSDPASRQAMRTGHCAALSLPFYREDEKGNPLSELQFMQAVSGHEDIFIFGNPGSITRLGPSDLKRPELWTVSKANDIAHFLEVVNCLRASEWVKARLTLSEQLDAAGEIQTTGFVQPDVLILNSVLVFIRQLVAKKDNLFALATNAYLCHVSNADKALYVQERRRLFQRAVDEPPLLFVTDRPGREVLELFLYGFGLIHRDDVLKDVFKEVAAKYGRERLVMTLHHVLQGVASVSMNVSHLLAQDFAHWIETGQAAGPDRIGIQEVLGPLR